MSEEEGDFIGCDDKNYQAKRFHLKCQRFTKTLKCWKGRKQSNNCSRIHVWLIAVFFL